MQCPICEKGEIKDYKDGTRCSNKNCQLPYNPPTPRKGDLRKRSPKSYRGLIGALFLIYKHKPGLIVCGAFIMGMLLVISWVWIYTTLII